MLLKHDSDSNAFVTAIIVRRCARPERVMEAKVQGGQQEGNDRRGRWGGVRPRGERLGGEGSDGRTKNSSNKAFRPLRISSVGEAMGQTDSRDISEDWDPNPPLIWMPFSLRMEVLERWVGGQLGCWRLLEERKSQISVAESPLSLSCAAIAPCSLFHYQ